MPDCPWCDEPVRSVRVSAESSATLTRDVVNHTALPCGHGLTAEQADAVLRDLADGSGTPAAESPGDERSA